MAINATAYVLNNISNKSKVMNKKKELQCKYKTKRFEKPWEFVCMSSSIFNTYLVLIFNFNLVFFGTNKKFV